MNDQANDKRESSIEKDLKRDNSEQPLEKNRDQRNRHGDIIIQSFGRRHSRPLKTSQKEALNNYFAKYGLELPKNVENPSNFFEKNDFSKVCMEIGFGGGEHLLENARQNPDCAFIGCEPFVNGFAKVMKKIHEDGLNNVKVYNGDARHFLALINDNSIDRFYVLFPDPWPKKRHAKRRLLSKEFFSTLLHDKLKMHGEIIIATDSEDYMQNILETLAEIPNFSLSTSDMKKLQNRPHDFIATRYEQKAISQGKKPFYLKVEKID